MTDAESIDPQEACIRRLLDLPESLYFRWLPAANAAGFRVLELDVPLAGARSLRLHLYRSAEDRSFWLRQGPASLHYCLDASGQDPFQDADLRRFLLALGARFRANLRTLSPGTISALLGNAGLDD